MSGISITCFAASYAVAWVLELSRLLFRSGIRGAVMVGFAAAGLVAHTLFLGYRAATTDTTWFDWYLLAAWILAGAYLYLTVYQTKTPFGVLLLPLVLGLIAVAQMLPDRRPVPVDHATLVWGRVHGFFLLGGTVAVIIGFVAGVMYLLQDYRLKRHLPRLGRVQLPSLEFLARINGRMIFFSVMLLLAGFLVGIVLNLVNHRRGAHELPWQDPVVWSSCILVVWMVAAALFNALYAPARLGRKVAYLTVASFAFLVIVLALQLALPTEHGGQSTGQGKVVGGRWSVVSAEEVIGGRWSVVSEKPAGLRPATPPAPTTDHRPPTTIPAGAQQ
jgi:hypothetical protein